jgi:hypothetical protein
MHAVSDFRTGQACLDFGILELSERITSMR